MLCVFPIVQRLVSWGSIRLEFIPASFVSWTLESSFCSLPRVFFC